VRFGGAGVTPAQGQVHTNDNRTFFSRRGYFLAVGAAFQVAAWAVAIFGDPESGNYETAIAIAALASLTALIETLR